MQQTAGIPVLMKKTLSIVLAFTLFNCGCSTVNLVYRNADWYLQYKINGYTSFNAEQKKLIRQDVSNYMHWHRENALPEYIIFLQNLNGAAQYEGRLEVANVTLLRTQLMDLYKETLRPAIRPAATILSMLDSRQIEELDGNFSKEIQKRRKDALDVSRDEYLDKRADRTISFIEWLAGDLSTEQEQKIREISRDLPAVADVYIQYQETSQKNLIALLNSHVGEEKIAEFLSSWIFTPEATRLPQQQIAIQSFERASDEMIARIQWMLTTTQKEHIRKMITSYIDDLRAAGESSPKSRQ
jgi:Family of unknown function (DUF6279)